MLNLILKKCVNEMRLMCAIWLNFNVYQLFFTGKNCAKQIDTESLMTEEDE
jgi:hypothetical protein